MKTSFVLWWKVVVPCRRWRPTMMMARHRDGLPSCRWEHRHGCTTMTHRTTAATVARPVHLECAWDPEGGASALRWDPSLVPSLLLPVHLDGRRSKLPSAAAVAGRALRSAPPLRRRWPESRAIRPRGATGAGDCPDRDSWRRDCPFPCRRRLLLPRLKLHLQRPAGRHPAGPWRTPTRCRASQRRPCHRPRPFRTEGPPRRTARAESATARPWRDAWRGCWHRHRRLCRRRPHLHSYLCYRRRRCCFRLLLPLVRVPCHCCLFGLYL